MTKNTLNLPVAVIAGAGEGNGQALAQRFSAAGYAVALLARNLERTQSLAAQIDHAHAYACDVGNAESVVEAFDAIRRELGETDVLLFNAGSGALSDIESVTPEQFESAWRVNALGSLLCAKQVIPAMKAGGKGNIVFIGATASRRGGANTAAFAPAKAAQRSLAESMARKLWPAGIHVSLLIIDGIVDLPATRKKMSDKAADEFVSPSAVAETAYNLTTQSPQGWSFETEVRPYRENW
ncbi:SDR family NAD(P)-dependent oxidoreductase [Brenneria nigrifluens DSM 30175 = ATCC 13028]|uniref:KR domain-containing protein n=2 Tax=Pectobacteriaceae TaxID=1903410 RepID=A0A2U1UFH6_9GAMM|nr:short-chain dehydrogenase/reductase SDR [Brenneria sp. EniD312]PWC20411.1 KR domain-containing protein [Brenneria nigrifluens DSM 30175 = ATCC 13028]QCR06794.1 SDR family NAD(P)-dependent oxidoreductase [Brenneria nigrifluens DSM 30175 = ATCC 13028]